MTTTTKDFNGFDRRRPEPGLASTLRTAEQAGPESVGSALVMAIFVLFLLTAMGASLLLVTETEMKMNQADQRSKKIFCSAEAGLEDARETLRILNSSAPSLADRKTFDDELLTGAGTNGVIDMTASGLRGVYDSSGNPTGFTGYGDDVPLRATATFGSNRYIAFLTNDIPDGEANTHDSNKRAVITAAAAGPSNAFETVQAIVEQVSFPEPPALITILGPLPDFDGGSSSSMDYSGDDCSNPSLHVPVLGVMGSAAVASAQAGVRQPAAYTSGSTTGTGTVTDVTGTIESQWTSCQYLLDLARRVRASADVVGDSSTPLSSLGTTSSPRIVYIEGDYDINGSFAGGGMIWVTGRLTFSGNASWTGMMYMVGQGEFVRSGAGNGDIVGASLVANVAGQDGVLWTADDCAGPDGVAGTSDDGIGQGVYDQSGGGNGSTSYCEGSIDTVQQEFPFAVLDFRQW